MKNPTIFADGGAKPFTKSKIMKKINCLAKIEKYFTKNRRKLWIFIFFDYLCEKIKN